MELALLNHLLADSGVSALAADRGFMVLRPQAKPVPAFTVNRIAGAEGVTLDGHDGLTPGLFQVDCWANTYAEAKALGDAVVAAVKLPAAGLRAILVEGESDDRERTDTKTLFKRSIDLRVWHQA